MSDDRRHFTNTRDYADWVSHEWDTQKKQRTVRHYTAVCDSEPRVRDGLRFMYEGDETHLRRAQELMDKFQESVEVPTRTWELSRVGAFPCVPAMLAGRPEAMFNTATITSDRTPLRVWVGLTSSAGISDVELAIRGCTLAAFALAMISIRPVYITPYVLMGQHSYDSYDSYGRGRSWSRGRSTPAGSENALISWDISTSPLVLSELMGCLSRSEVTRYVGILACNLLNKYTDGGWHRDYSYPDKMRQNLGASPDDLVLGSIHWDDPMLTQPLEWVKDQVAKYTEETA